jgi:KTSC domain
MASVPHQSSVLAVTEYFPELQTLDVVFTSGEIYHYSNVPLPLYQDLLAADSKGIFFNAHIRNHFPFQYLGNTKVTANAAV